MSRNSILDSVIAGEWHEGGKSRRIGFLRSEKLLVYNDWNATSPKCKIPIKGLSYMHRVVMIVHTTIDLLFIIGCGN